MYGCAKALSMNLSLSEPELRPRIKSPAARPSVEAQSEEDIFEALGFTSRPACPAEGMGKSKRRSVTSCLNCLNSPN